MKKLKVLHVQLLPLLSGVQRVSLNEIQNLSSKFDYSLVCAENGPLTELLSKNNIPCFNIPPFCRDISFSRDLSALTKLYRLIKRERFDIVHTHSSKTGVLGRIAAKIARVPKVIHTVHGYAFPAATSKKSYYLYFFMEWFAKFFTDILVVLNEDDRKIAVDKLGYAPEKVHIIPNGVDIQKFSPENKMAVTGMLRIIMVGRLWPQKDPRTLLLAVKELLSKGVNVTVSFVGDGELMSQLTHLAADEKERINFLGWKDDIDKILPDYDVFVLPSLWEGMPLAILEAMSSGLPCLVTNIPGNKDLVKDGFNGYLFETGDYKKLAELIYNYSQDSDLLLHHSVNSRKYIEDNFTLNIRNGRIAKLYNV